MRKRIHSFLTHRIFIIVIVIAIAFLGYLTGALGYFLGLLTAIVLLIVSRFNLSEFGIGKVKWGKSILKAIAYTIGIYIIADMIVQPLIESSFGKIDLGGIEDLKGNIQSYLFFSLYMWIIAAIGEEFVFRGYLMKQLAKVYGNKNISWFFAALTVSVIFGLAHLYQGVSGMLITGFIGFLLSMVFYFNRKNLVVAILTHGFYDMIALTLIYLGKDQVVNNWVQSFF